MLKKRTWTSIFVLGVLVIAANDSEGQAITRTNGGHASAYNADKSHINFEVASIKRSDPKQEIQILNALLTYPGGRMVARGATLEYLLTEAYSLQRFQLVGGPSWLHETRFEIEAKPPADVAARFINVPNPKNPPPDELRQMLCNLLTERFRLKLHFEQSEGNIYELVRGRGPLHLNPSKDKNEYPWAGSLEGGNPNGDGLRGMNISMSNLASRVSFWLSTPVVDHTGLSGAYDFQVVLGSDEDASNFGVQNSILESVKELGLELKKSKGLVQRLVVVQASLPTDN
jgi:uncharacterized protein (TIGR03435 family)